MKSFSLGELDRYLLQNHVGVIELQRSWEDLENRVLGLLTEKNWTRAISEEGVKGRWEVHLTKGSRNPLFRRDDWLDEDDEWTCLEVGNLTLRGLLTSDSEDQAWVGLWWGRLRDRFEEADLRRSAQKWRRDLPLPSGAVEIDKNWVWWCLDLGLREAPEKISELANLVVRDWARLGLALDEIAEMSRRGRKGR